jgi:hypothetical protein
MPSRDNNLTPSKTPTPRRRKGPGAYVRMNAGLPDPVQSPLSMKPSKSKRARVRKAAQVKAKQAAQNPKVSRNIVELAACTHLWLGESPSGKEGCDV